VDDVAMTSLDDVTPAADDNYGLPFRLEPVRRHGSSFDLRLIVTQQLDREVRKEAFFLIYANYM